MKKSLITLSLLATQLLLLTGNATLSKSAQQKTTKNMINNKEHYSKQISQSFFDEFNQQKQAEREREERCKKERAYYREIGYDGGETIVFIKNNNEIYFYSQTGCSITFVGYEGGRTTCETGLGNLDYNQMGDLKRCYQYQWEGNKLCRYTRHPSGDGLQKGCWSKILNY